MKTQINYTDFINTAVTKEMFDEVNEKVYKLKGFKKEFTRSDYVRNLITADLRKDKEKEDER